MQRRLYQIRRFVTRHVWWPLAQFSHVVHPAPLLSGVIIFLLLAFVGQIHEIYLLYLEPPYDIERGYQLAFAGGALALLSAALYLLNYYLSDVTIEIVWSQHRDVDRDSRLRACRKFAGLFVAALPWAGVWAGVLYAGSIADKNIKEINKAKSLGGPVQEATAAIKALEDVLDGLEWTLLVIALCGAAVVIFLHLSRRNARMRYSVLGLIGLLFLAAVVAPSFVGKPESVQVGVDVFRRIGPLAMMILDVLLVFACAAVLVLLSREVGVPVIALVVAIGLVAMPLGQVGVATLLAGLFVVVAVLALLSWRWQLLTLSAVLVALSAGFFLQLRDPDRQEAPAHRAPDLAEAYHQWLAARADVRDAYQSARSGRPYPVFIVAAEGGGIYAASAASAFLSRLQEYCPSFAQHVFAISGVSGGAVGASVFQSVIRGEQIKTTGCNAPGTAARGEISKQSSAAIQDDHLSPLLGFIVADMLGIYDRARGLEQSLVRSAKALGTPFDLHWQPDKAAPALVLNATWAENGHRVAFAPFTFGRTLENLKGKTLHSFGDGYFSDHRLRRTTIAEAAVVSARFPAILPAFTIVSGKHHWNFVDGGYKDSSGALTALEIFNVIRAASPKEVAPRLILLTSTRAEFDPKDVRGMGVPNLFAPAITLLSVRDRLAEDAVSRTITAVESSDVENLAARTMRPQPGLDDWKVTLVELNQQAFNLSLGWTISKSTHAIVSIQMGYPELCHNPAAKSEQDPDAERDTKEKKYISIETLKKNSCVMKSVVQLLSLHEQSAQ